MEITLPSQAWARNKKNSPSIPPLTVWRFCTKIIYFMCQHHKPLSWYIGWNLRQNLWENILQLRSRGSDAEVAAAATLLHLHRLHWDYQKVAVLQAADFSGWHKLIWEKDLLEKALSELRTIDSCALTSSLSLFWVTRPAASINYQLVFFNQ